MPLEDFLPQLDVPILAIVGHPAAGKSTLANKLAGLFQNRRVIHGEEFLHMPWADQAKNMIDVVSRIEDAYIVEGVPVYRMLRTGATKGTWAPTIVIRVIEPLAILKYAKMNKGLDTIWKSYQSVAVAPSIDLEREDL